MEDKLPEKMSDVLELALHDIERVETSPQYEIDMTNWHIYDRITGVCSVCMAGAVMAQTLGVPFNETTSLTMVEVSDDDKTKLCILDDVRSSHFIPLLDFIKGEDDEDDKYRPLFKDIMRFGNIVRYHESPTQFKKDVQRLAETLRKHGY